MAVPVDEEVELCQCADSDLGLWRSGGGVTCRTGKRKYRLRAVCLHRGNKADFGHYVAAYREEGVKEWVLCNDSKVVLAADAPVSECYLAFYEKIHCLVCSYQ